METVGSNEQLIQSSFNGEEYGKLLHFFQDVWLSDATYKVFMARRAFNLNYAFMSIKNVQYKDEYKVDGIMSNTAVLLCAEEIANYYRSTECFPRIIIVDDLLIHGRGIIKLISSLEYLIVDFLQNDRACNIPMQVIHEKLLDAVNIYVFAENANDILLDSKFALKSVMRLPVGELRALSQKISRALQQCGVTNTSYVLSAELPWIFCKRSYSNRDSRSLFQYRGNVLCYYYRNSNEKALETIRVYCSDFKHMATSLVIFGDIAYDKNQSDCHLNVLCRGIAQEIRQIIPYSRIADILSYEQPWLVRPRTQMISYLLSVLNYSSFYREKISSEPQTIYKALMQSDYPKIIANFDRPKKLQFEIVQLFSFISQDDSLHMRILECMEEHVNRLNIGEDIAERSDVYQTGKMTYLKSQTLHEIAEDIFYEVGINSEYDAYRNIQTRTTFDPSKQDSGFIRLEQYLHFMKRLKADSISSIGCAFNLMDSGLLAMNLELNHSQDAVQCVLKAGELSTFVLPRRFSVFVPALSIVERECVKKGTGKKAVVSRFIDYLQMHCYQENGVDSAEDIELLCKLSQSKSSLLYMYSVGQSFQDWDVELLTAEDRLSHGMDEQGNFNMNKYVLWTSNELKRIRHYSYCAKIFLHSGNM